MATLQDVRDKIEWEGGFEYFYGGSDFKEVEDEEFHKRREALVTAWGELEEYLYANTKGEGDEEEEIEEDEDDDDHELNNS